MPLTNAGYLADYLQAILDTTYTCLEDTVDGPPASKYLYWTTPPDDCCDILAVWLDAILPTREFPVVLSGADECGDSWRMMRVKVRLVRACWPTLRDNATSPFPSPVDMQAATENLLVDANVVWCCLQTAFAEGTLFPDMQPCTNVRWDDLTPDPPRGGCAGFTLTLMVELDAGCECSDEPVSS